MRFAAIVLIFVLAASVAIFAAGGGSGGGPPPPPPPPPDDSGGGTGSSTGSGPQDGTISSLKCYDTGSIRFTIANHVSRINNLTAISPAKQSFNVTGTWSGTIFVSDEVLFIENGLYKVNGFSVFCPGLAFSCLKTSVDVRNCTQHEGYAEATVYIGNLDPLANMTYYFTTPAGTLMYSLRNKSQELTQFSIRQAANSTYAINASAQNITRIQVRSDACSYMVEKTCAKELHQEKREFFCYELDLLEDRIRCRLGLEGEEQEKERELEYLPEECRALTEKDGCIRTYDSVQRCWTYPEGEVRVNCVRGIIGFSNIRDENAKCADDRCRGKIRENVYTLVKFRFYDLEERAEELYSRHPDLVISFIASIEKKKQEFNTAGTIAEKKQVVLQVRELWKQFSGEVNLHE